MLAPAWARPLLFSVQLTSPRGAGWAKSCPRKYLDPNQGRCKCNALWRVSWICLKEAFLLHSPSFTPTGTLVCHFLWELVPWEKLYLCQQTAGHLLHSWRSDVHWSHLGKTEASKGSGLNSINVRRTLLVSMALDYWRVGTMWIFCSDLEQHIHSHGGEHWQLYQVHVGTHQDCWARHASIVQHGTVSVW